MLELMIPPKFEEAGRKGSKDGTSHKAPEKVLSTSRSRFSGSAHGLCAHHESIGRRTLAHCNITCCDSHALR